ncbi:GDP-mannose 4,6-dehydratase [Bacillus thuringiensis]|nr:GDP-mannose 4,6-dehydratase [Bacillus thuringiensis]MDZ3952415.1 GDP-mannose 4,6-dehydratase [Bacillus thuringiensis]
MAYVLISIIKRKGHWILRTSSITPYFFKQAHVANVCTTVQGDVTDIHSLLHTVKQYKPDILFHLAANYSYHHPIKTFKTNILGTVHILEAVKQTVYT